MIPAGTQPAAPPNDPVRTALDDSALRDGLLEHALAILGKRLRHRPATDRSDAAMVAFQETCVRALEKRHDYVPTLPVRPWLHGIMNLVLCETIRGVRRLPAQELKDAAAWEALAIDLTPDVAETVPNRLAAADYLASLKGEDRQVLELRFYQGLSHDDIASRLGITPGNARVRLCRALIALKAVAAGTLQEDKP
jgi:RNA polymerase sigma-70 factor (ECF subfamily)